MNLFLLKTIFYHYFFLINILVIFSVSKFFEIKNITIPYQTVICFFLISIIGVSHGGFTMSNG